MELTISAPIPIHEQHDLSAFQSGEEGLDEWVKRRAMKNQSAGASRTYVIAVN